MISLRLPGGTLFSPPKPAEVTPLAPLPTTADPAIAQKKKDEEMALRKRKGMGDTILTSGLGDTSTANVERPSAAAKTVLGG